MSDLRAKPTDLCMADAMPWNQHYEYRTTWPLAEIVNDTFFLPTRDQLRAGDQITMCRFDSTDDRTKALTEIVTVRVIRAGRGFDTVPLHVMGKIETISDQSQDMPIVARGFAGKFVVKRGEEVISEHGSKSEAEDALSQMAA